MEQEEENAREEASSSLCRNEKSLQSGSKDEEAEEEAVAQHVPVDYVGPYGSTDPYESVRIRTDP